MSHILRRSQRHRKTSSYEVGDVLKISRSCGIISNGRLVYKLTEGRSPSRTLWLVTFDDEGDAKDEEVYETRFGKLVRSAKETSGQTEECDVETTKQTISMTLIEHQEKKKLTKTVQSKLGQIKEKEDKKRRKKSEKPENENFEDIPSRQSPVTVFDTSYTYDTATSEKHLEPKVSTREQRSLRRQAKIDQIQKPEHTAARYRQQRGKKRTAGANTKVGSKNKKAKSEKEEVITVKLNTGVLYLYRGLNRRAEFIRKV